MAEAFVYCWTDKRTNKLYIGSHRGHPNDGYICSSRYMIEEYTKRSTDFSRQIIAEGEIEDIRKLEHIILISADAANNPLFAETKKKVAKIAGKASVKSRPSNYNQIQSERIKLWWKKRKEFNA